MVHGASSDSCYEFSGWLQSNTMQNVFALSILQKIYFKTAFHFAFLEYRSVCIGLRFFRVHKHSNGRFHGLWTHNEAFFHWGGLKFFFRASCFGFIVKGVCPLLLPLVSLISAHKCTFCLLKTEFKTKKLFQGTQLSSWLHIRGSL
jgi:hypothetical protein